MSPFAFPNVGSATPPLLPLNPPSDKESKQRQDDECTDGRETTNDPAAERVATTSRAAEGVACSVDDALRNAFAKGTSIKR